MSLHGGPVERLNELLAGKIIEAVESPTEAEEGGVFILRVREVREDGKLGKLIRVRVCATDLGWWFETQRRASAQWENG
jgi:hypothetical protein